MKAPFGLALAALFCSTALHAEPAIERVKFGDDELSCRDLNAEASQMDKIMAEAKADETGGNATTAAGTAAKVAGGVGVFAQLGGLVGHVAGQVAAGVAQQSGQQSAEQAAERGRQALARKEQVSGLFVDKGCNESDLSYEPPAQSAKLMKTAYVATAAGGGAAAALAPAAPLSVLPDNDPDQFFKGKMGGTFGADVVEVLPNNKRVAVLGFRVAFVTSNQATAQVRASYLPGRDTSGASSKLTVNLAGVDAATMQTLTDWAYADFLAQLQLAGREVVPPEEIKEFLGGLETTPYSVAQPFAKDVQAMKLAYFAPTGTPLWFNNWDAQWGNVGPFDQANMRRVGEYSYKLNAIAIAPLIVVDFTKMSSSGNQSGLVARTAETGAEMSMRVTHFSTGYVRTDEFRNGLVMKGDNGSVQLTNANVVSALEFGSLRKATSEDNSGAKGIFDELGKSLGMANAGGAARSSTTSVAETNNAAYGAAAADALRTATGTFAKLFQKYPPH